MKHAILLLAIGSLGLAGYARMMERFASGERAINRAWSAAADGFTSELESDLARAEEALADAAGKMG